jgi:hypothetical protein
MLRTFTGFHLDEFSAVGYAKHVYVPTLIIQVNWLDAHPPYCTKVQ